MYIQTTIALSSDSSAEICYDKRIDSCVLHNSSGMLTRPEPLRPPLPSARQHPSYGDCLEVKREYYQNRSVLDCATQ